LGTDDSRYGPPTPTEREAFLLGLYFGTERPFIDRAIDRAYLDLSRTLHGIARKQNRADLRKNSSRLLREALLRVESSSSSQDAFDSWHRELSTSLIDVFEKGGFPDFTVGQAQKWINMAVKYVALFGDLAEFCLTALMQVGHMPIDSIILDRLVSMGLSPDLRPRAWSRVQSYDSYMALQMWVRTRFAGSSPLVVEFHLWKPVGKRARATTTVASATVSACAEPQD